VEPVAFVLDLALAVLAALAGGVVAQRLGQPVLLGYLLAGVALGPFTPGPTVDPHAVEALAEIGVAFLMFAVGAEVSLDELRRLGRVTGLGGALQIGATMALGPLLAPALGLSFGEGVFLGALLALSSTVVAVTVLMGRGELQALHGRVALGLLVTQDLAVVPMVVALPVLTAPGGLLTGGLGGLGAPAGGGGAALAALAPLGVVALKAGAILAGAYLVGTRAVPWLLGRVAGTRTRELFLLAVVGLTLGTALLTHAAGLSLAFGAFLAGLVAGDSEYRAQVVAEVLPLRDLFASLFFVSVGLLIDPRALVASAGAVALLVGAVVVGKTAIVVSVVRLLGLPGPVALLAGLGLAQVGEFSFVLARLGVARGAVPPAVFELTLATALVTIVLTPTLLAAAPRVQRVLQGVPGVGRHFAPPLEPDPTLAGAGLEAPGGPAPLRGHTVICGYGRVGRELAEALARRGVRYLVVEYHPLVVRELRAEGVPVVYGDAAQPAVLEHAYLEGARVLAALMPDARAAEAATRHARRLNPRLDVVARARGARDVERLRQAGASEVVQPEFEAGVEVIRHALRRYGVSGQELTQVAASRREAFYRRAAAARPEDGPA
jgi:CPA2 family monovalent cation:H+ antiporter-2